MFTGIIERVGTLVDKKNEGSNVRFVIFTDIIKELKVDQSIAHNGVCLTVEKIRDHQTYEVVAVKETLEKTNLNRLTIGDSLNIERCMQMNARLEGHIVQGHVDCTAEVMDVEKIDGSWLYSFRLQKDSQLIVEKGSICINGVSLTAFNVSDNSFQVTIIPYTFEHTNFNKLEKNNLVNIEFDILGKYVARMMKSGD